MGNKRHDEKPVLSVTLKDCDLQTYSAGGAGGQHRDHGNSAVRIVHRASGATGTASDSRSQHDNKRSAFIRMTKDRKFGIWLNRMLWYAGKSPEDRVVEDLKPKNLRVEIRDDGHWVPFNSSEGKE